MKEKILATFRLDPDKWEAFKTLASEENSNATNMLLDFIDWCLDGNRINKGKSKTTKVQNRPDNLDERLDKLAAERIDTLLNERLSAVYTELEDLRGKLSA